MAEDVVVRVGIVGLGIAARQVLTSIQRTAGAQLTAVCDVRADEVERFKQRFSVEGFTDVREMVRHGPIDAVWVATPNDLHAEHTILAADHGKHVICEKPMAVSLDEATRMVEAIERNGVTYVQGHSRIHRPYVRKIGEILASGRLGRALEVVQIRIGAPREIEANRFVGNPVGYHRDLGAYISERDLQQLFIKSLEAPDIRDRYGVPFQIFYGVSGNTRRFWSIVNAREVIGYEPQDDSEAKYAADIRAHLTSSGAPVPRREFRRGAG